MSCSADSCKCMFPTKRIWSAIWLGPVELVINFQQLNVFFNGRLLTPSFAFGKKAAGEYDLMDELMVFSHNIKEDDVVNIIYKNSKYIYHREQCGWELIAVLENKDRLEEQKE